MKNKRYWLRGGITFSSIGLGVVFAIFALGYSDCFVNNLGESCEGLVLGTLLLGAPLLVFAQEVLRVDLLSIVGFFYFEEVFGGGIFYELIQFTIWGVITNFLAGSFIGWLYGKFKNRGHRMSGIIK